MYFTQEKNKFESLHIIVTLIALFMHQIAHWRVIRYYELVVLFSLFYVPNFLPKQWKLLLWDWVEWKFILLWVPYAVYCSFGLKNSSEFSGCYHESVLSPLIAQLISASHIKTAPSCIRELVNEWCNGNWLWKLNRVTLLQHHHNKHWITERKQNTRQSKTSYVSVINVCTKVMSCDIEKCDTCVTCS